MVDLDITLAPVRGGAFFLQALAPEGEQLVQRKAVEFLSDPARRGPAPAELADEEIRDLVRVLSGEEIDETMLAMAREELAFEDFPRETTWTGERPAEALQDFRVIVVGAGVSGIAMGIKLQRLGIPFTIIERLDDITGTWHRNRYPDVRVDTNCFLYQFKFEKRYPWPEFFPRGRDVKRYLEHLVDKYGIAEHVVLGQEVVDAAWNEQDAAWEVEAVDAHGATVRHRGQVLVSASGVFSTPRWPDIPGMETFAGRVLHTADWDTQLEWTGLRVGVIGNGSTGTQLMPRLAQSAAHVTAFQRTPQWIINSPLLGAKITPELQWLIDAMPYYWNWAGFVQFFGTAQTQMAQIIDKDWQAAGGLINERNDRLREALVDYVESKVGHVPHLRDHSIPDYAPLARRLVIDNGWFDALLRSNVSLEVSSIEEIVPEGVRLVGGEVVPLDVLILATGFHVSRYFHPATYRGRDGLTLDEAWSGDGARAYLGLTMPGFPNFYSLYGPNATPRFGGFPQWVDVWSRYILDLVVEQVETGARSVEVRRDVFDDYNARMDRATAALLWESEGQGSYFVNEHGRSGLQMPWEANLYHSWVRAPDRADFSWSD
ncbi:flavin-containing monooxygenase [Nocardioides marinisabuli]|uniref:flavin-containing monooxygenase n=1 Tax=Nocardioides marinisabuli TaxID=419476 RepID=UPI0015CC8B8F|nr:NAD(P)/FAD-dependent oxidoreductase [Nocardioides marinisabuli]